MPYTVQRLAPGSFDLLLDEEIVGSLVRDMSQDGHLGDWRAEVLDGAPPFPPPFKRETHKFRTLTAAAEWLGVVLPET